MNRLLLSLLLFLFLNTVSAGEPQKVITIYGVENGSQLKVRDQGNFKYQLQIGAFKDQVNAIKCKNRFQKKTTMTIQIRPPKTTNGIYAVVLGPLQDSSTLRTISKQLAAKNKVLPSKIANQAAIKSQAVTEMKVASKGVVSANHETIPIKPEEASQQPASEVLASPEVQNAPELQTKQLAETLQMATNLDKENESLAIEALNQESVNNDLQLKMATNPAQIVALQKRQVEISQELENKVTSVIERIQQASH